MTVEGTMAETEPVEIIMAELGSSVHRYTGGTWVRLSWDEAEARAKEDPIFAEAYGRIREQQERAIEARAAALPPRVLRRQTPDPERIAALEAAIKEVCEEHGFKIVHFTSVGRRPGYLPWISAHFEQHPERPAPEPSGD